MPAGGGKTAGIRGENRRLGNGEPGQGKCTGFKTLPQMPNEFWIRVNFSVILCSPNMVLHSKIYRAI